MPPIDGSITKVDVYDGATLMGTATAAPYSISWANVAAGRYSLTAVATDDRGATTTSAPVAITVNALPTVSISSPASGATFNAPATIAVSANATDADGTVAKVDFYQGTTLIGTATAAPYSITWSNVAAGSYTLTAVATDNDGAATTSAPVTVTVKVVSTLYFIQVDQLGTPRLIADQNQNTVWRWDNQEPFGADTPNQDPGNSGTSFDFPLRFPGQYYDRETNLAYNMARDYSPEIGRYVESDPIGLTGGINTYAYVDGIPIGESDPLGLMGFGGGGSANPSWRQTHPAPSLQWKLQGPNVIDPSKVNPELFLFVRCVQDCYPDPITITATTNGHTTGAHVKGRAVDFLIPSGIAGTNQAMCCVFKCGAKYAQDEYHYPSPNSTGGHIHAQLIPGLGGATGTGRYPAPQCNSCPSSASGK